MKLSVQKGRLETTKTDLLVLGIPEGWKKLAGAAAAVDAAMDGKLSLIAREELFDGGNGSTLVVRTDGAIPAARVLLVGLGSGKPSEERVREFAAIATSNARRLKVKRVASTLLGAGDANMSGKRVGQVMAEGALLGAYTYHRYKSEPQVSTIETYVMVTTNATAARQAMVGIERGEVFARATMLARDLVNTPAAHMSPSDLADAAQKAVKGMKNVTLKRIEAKELRTMGAGGLLGIGQGSDHEPVLVHMVYKPKGAKKRVALVGKAITFDTGGYSIKPAASMEIMKLDMAGAASVIGAFSVLDQLAPDVEVHGIFGACENMVSGGALRPGDVVKIMNGKTMEIRNTDAEGRVTLADTLTYAVRQEPDAIIDLATLTGACVVALGEEITGAMGNNPALMKRVLTASQIAGDSMWELPLEQRYKSAIKCEVADYKNDTPRWGGAITAGLLLEEFVAGKPWVHLDIAGPAYAEKPLNAYTRHGATGHPVRTLLELLMSY